jgi:hypothetical protein
MTRSNTRCSRLTSPKPNLRAFVFISCVLALAEPATAQEPAGPGPIVRGAAQQAARFASRSEHGAGDTQLPPAERAWSQAMQMLSPGSNVRVTLDEGVALRGTFRMADDQSMTLGVAGSDRQLMRTQVRRVAVANGTRRRRHENIGMLVGAVAAGLVMTSRCRGRGGACEEESMLYYFSLMTAGAGVGHVLPPGTAWREIYRRSSI